MYESRVNKEAAERRKDTEMLTRLHGVPDGDLVAIEEARYHRSKSCYLKYIKLQKLDVKQPEGSENRQSKWLSGN